MRPPGRDGNPLIRFLKAKVYGVLRRVVPSVKEQYRLGRMIGPIGYWDEIRAYQIGFHRRMGLEPHHRLLDIGCGPLPGGLAFIDYLEAGNYCGVDVSLEAIEEGRRQVAKAGLAEKDPTLVVSSTFGRDELDGRTFDYVWASQILYHLDESGIAALLQQVSRRLEPGGVFHGDIIGKPERIGPDSQWNGYTFHLHTLEGLDRAAREHGLRATALGGLREFGYPPGPNMGTNRMLAFRPIERDS
jgi:SAM-dependent methyltransferase